MLGFGFRFGLGSWACYGVAARSEGHEGHGTDLRVATVRGRVKGTARGIDSVRAKVAVTATGIHGGGMGHVCSYGY